MTKTPLATLLEKLTKVKKSGARTWLACCPAHDDTRPSLSIREFDDGSISVKCFSSSCSTAAILGAVGLHPSDLFPSRQDDDYSRRRRGGLAVPAPVPDLVRYLREDMYATMCAVAKMAAGEQISEEDCTRLGLAALRIHEALSLYPS